MDQPKADILAFMTFPNSACRPACVAWCRPCPASPNEAAVPQRVDASLLEPNDDWPLRRVRPMTLGIVVASSGAPLITLRAA